MAAIRIPVEVLEEVVHFFEFDQCENLITTNAPFFNAIASVIERFFLFLDQVFNGGRPS